MQRTQQSLHGTAGDSELLSSPPKLLKERTLTSTLGGNVYARCGQCNELLPAANAAVITSSNLVHISSGQCRSALEAQHSVSRSLVFKFRLRVATIRS
eukprot:1507147-Amphidinium_carterae.1